MSAVVSDRSVMLTAPNDCTYTATGVWHVAGVPRDYMAVAVHDRLACRDTYVQPDVVPVGFVRSLYTLLTTIDEIG